MNDYMVIIFNMINMEPEIKRISTNRSFSIRASQGPGNNLLLKLNERKQLCQAGRRI